MAKDGVGRCAQLMTEIEPGSGMLHVVRSLLGIRPAVGIL